MTCKEFNQRMKDFFDNSIEDERVLDGFAEHYHTCKECREEMEIQYILQLKPEDWLKDEIYDFGGSLRKIVEKEEEELNVCKLVKMISFRVMLCAAFAVIVVIGYQFVYWMR